jgi:hypothetical protein
MTKWEKGECHWQPSGKQSYLEWSFKTDLHRLLQANLANGDVVWILSRQSGGEKSQLRSQEAKKDKVWIGCL